MLKRLASITAFILICFFLSGLTGLIYEILWTRMLVKIIGGAPFAVSIVLTVFMAGLGIGSFFAGRFVDKIEKSGSLIKLYGLLELVIALFALLIPLAIDIFEPLYSFIYNRMFDHFLLFYFLTLVGCTIILIGPVICMGATLPVLCRFCARSISSIGLKTGVVYGLNTIGAATGALVCGFWLIGEFGMQVTFSIAVVLNCVIGFSCLLIGSRKRLFEGVPQITEENKVSESPATGSSALVTFVIMLAFGVSGFCCMSYEVIWTRLLALIIGPITYSFTIVLVTFITGLALGSFFFGWLADRIRNALSVFLLTQLLAGLSALFVSQLLGNSQLFYAKLIDAYRDSFFALSLLKGLSLFAFMVLPTLFLGAAFPLVIRICTRTVTKLGNTVGISYAVNTIGDVLGSFAAGFLIIPLLGKETGLSVVVTVQLLSVLLVAIVLIRRRFGLTQFAVVAALLLPSFYFVSKYPAWDRLSLAIGKYQRIEGLGIDVRQYGWLNCLFNEQKLLARTEKGVLVYYGDGIGGFTTVLKYSNPIGFEHYSLINSGKPDASSHRDMRTQTLLAHFPMLFHSGAKDVMVLGLASGVTSGEALCYPVRQVDTLEISPQVVEACKFFNPWNNNVLSDPRSRIILQDARAHLQLTDKTYDVIISEPSNPWMEGLATLFTQDFFELVKNHLNEGGIFSQFFHSYQMDWDTFAMVGRTFASVFPNSLMLVTHPSGTGIDYILVGFRDKYDLELSNAEKNLAFAQKSKNVHLSDPKLLFRMLVAEDLNLLFGKGAVNTDRLPLLEFTSPKKMYTPDDSVIRRKITENNTLRKETRAVVAELRADIDSQIEYAGYALSINEPYADMVDWKAATGIQKEQLSDLFAQYCKRDFIDFKVLPDDLLRQRCLNIYIAIAEEKLKEGENLDSLYRFLGDSFYLLGNMDKSIGYYEKMVALDPNNSAVLNNLGIAYLQTGNLDRAIKSFEAALKAEPTLVEAAKNLEMCRKAKESK